MTTQEYRVTGPVALFVTTTTPELDEELLNRCLVLTVDEGAEQTRRIQERQRAAQTLQGPLRERRQVEKVLRAGAEGCALRDVRLRGGTSPPTPRAAKNDAIALNIWYRRGTQYGQHMGTRLGLCVASSDCFASCGRSVGHRRCIRRRVSGPDYHCVTAT